MRLCLLCTEAFLFVRYSFLLIFNKFCDLSLLQWPHTPTYGPLIDTALFVMLLMTNPLMRLNLFGPQMAHTLQHDAVSQCLKKPRFPGPNTLPLALVMDFPHNYDLGYAFKSTLSVFAQCTDTYVTDLDMYLDMLYEPLKKSSSLLCPSLNLFSKNTPTPTPPPPFGANRGLITIKTEK